MAHQTAVAVNKGRGRWSLCTDMIHPTPGGGATLSVLTGIEMNRNRSPHEINVKASAPSWRRHLNPVSPSSTGTPMKSGRSPVRTCIAHAEVGLLPGSQTDRPDCSSGPRMCQMGGLVFPPQKVDNGIYKLQGFCEDNNLFKAASGACLGQLRPNRWHRHPTPWSPPGGQGSFLSWSPRHRQHLAHGQCKRTRVAFIQ